MIFSYTGIIFMEVSIMNTDIQYVLRALEKAPMGKKIDDYRVVVKCPICGEGSKQRTHGHCYIGMVNDGPSGVFYKAAKICSECIGLG